MRLMLGAAERHSYSPRTKFAVIFFVVLLSTVLIYNSFPRFFDSSPVKLSTSHTIKTSALTSALVAHNYVKRPYAAFHQSEYWPGWSGIENLIIFGDSWTTTSTELDGPMPTLENPLGNPPFPGDVSTNGPNWLGYFVTLYNATFVRALNIAAGGATIDMDLIAPEGPHEALRPFKMQVHDQYVPMFGNPPPQFAWKPDNTLIIIWIGLNDLHNANNETEKYFGTLFEEYTDCLDQIYQTGARNFLLMNIPPIERAPLAEIIDETERWTGWVDAWNRNMTDMATNMTDTYPDTSMFIFDTYAAYDEAMDDPCTFPETCHYKDTTHFCWAYAFSASDPEFKHEKCPYKISEYLWMNDLHPTSITHNMTAHAVYMAVADED